MIINSDYLNKKRDYLKEEKEGLERAVHNLEKRYKNEQVEKKDFFAGLHTFAKRGEDLNKRIDKLNRK